MSTDSNAVAELLRVSRLNVSELARRSGVSRASVSEYVHGHRQPSVGQVQRLAVAAGRRAEVSFPLAWDSRKSELEDVLGLADALPLRAQPPSTRTWAEITRR